MSDDCDMVDSYLSINFGVKFAGHAVSEKTCFTDDVQMDTITMDAHVMAIALLDCVNKTPRVLTLS